MLGFVETPSHALFQHGRSSPLNSSSKHRRRAVFASLSPEKIRQDSLKIVNTLRKDLPQQYDKPFQLDFSVYDRHIEFTDPVTRLPRSRLLYKGMLYSISLVVRLLFKRGSVAFELDECNLISERQGESCGRIHTKFRTYGRTRWQSEDAPLFAISGEDDFWLAESSDKSDQSVKINYHESMWDQTPEEVNRAFWRRR